MSKVESLLPDMENAVNRLAEVLAMPKTEVVRDSAIKRFEFCFDLSWKTLKAFLEERHGINVASPKEAFREAYRQKVIDYDNFWLEIVDKRNLTVHTYRESAAEEVYAILPKALTSFKDLLAKIKLKE
ncbi:MAG: HI0074 family nucleotidyltransferase substrate-binding subunit [Candidatus Doudnabacteria bacterium]|nr:HI0074 family nucleotidyltransferase substrate-binding subunit [Candidatus Doudnabacteria bacterium]